MFKHSNQSKLAEWLEESGAARRGKRGKRVDWNTTLSLPIKILNPSSHGLLHCKKYKTDLINVIKAVCARYLAEPQWFVETPSMTRAMGIYWYPRQWHFWLVVYPRGLWNHMDVFEKAVHIHVTAPREAANHDLEHLKQWNSSLRLKLLITVHTFNHY